MVEEGRDNGEREEGRDGGEREGGEGRWREGGGRDGGKREEGGGTVEREWRVCEGEKGKQERARREGERKQRRGYEKGGEVGRELKQPNLPCKQLLMRTRQVLASITEPQI